jgi:hypothetical protein
MSYDAFLGATHEARGLAVSALCAPHSGGRPEPIGRTNAPLPPWETTHAISISARAQAIRFSLRAEDPAEVKARTAAADQYLERILRAFRDDATTTLTNAQATALAGRLYRAWAAGEGRERTLAAEQGADGQMKIVPGSA